MFNTPRSSSIAPTVTEQAPRGGPVPLAPELLMHVSGGQGEDGAPRGRWLPIDELTSADDEAAPRGRW